MSQQNEASIRLVFDFALRDGEAPTRLTFVDPVKVYAAYQIDEVPTVLEAVQEATAKQNQWAAGFVSYEAASAFDPAMVTHPPMPGLPLAWFGVFSETSDALSPCPSPNSGRGESEKVSVYGFARALGQSQGLGEAAAVWLYPLRLPGIGVLLPRYTSRRRRPLCSPPRRSFISG